MTLPLDRLIDGRKDDGVLGHMDDSPAASKVSDDFVFALVLRQGVKRKRAEDYGEKDERNSAHKWCSKK